MDLHKTSVVPVTESGDVSVLWKTAHVNSLPLSDRSSVRKYDDVIEYVSLPRSTTFGLVTDSIAYPARFQVTLTVCGRNPDAVQRAVRSDPSTTELPSVSSGTEGRSKQNKINIHLYQCVCACERATIMHVIYMYTIIQSQLKANANCLPSLLDASILFYYIFHLQKYV